MFHIAVSFYIFFLVFIPKPIFAAPFDENGVQCHQTCIAEARHISGLCRGSDEVTLACACQDKFLRPYAACFQRTCAINDPSQQIAPFFQCAAASTLMSFSSASTPTTLATSVPSTPSPVSIPSKSTQASKTMIWVGVGIVGVLLLATIFYIATRFHRSKPKPRTPKRELLAGKGRYALVGVGSHSRNNSASTFIGEVDDIKRAGSIGYQSPGRESHGYDDVGYNQDDFEEDDINDEERRMMQGYGRTTRLSTGASPDTSPRSSRSPSPMQSRSASPSSIYTQSSPLPPAQSRSNAPSSSNRTPSPVPSPSRLQSPSDSLSSLSMASSPTLSLSAFSINALPSSVPETQGPPRRFSDIRPLPTPPLRISSISSTASKADP